MKKAYGLAVLFLVCSISAFLFSRDPIVEVRRYPASTVETRESVDRFLFSDFGSISLKGLETNTIPLKISITGLILLGRQEGWISKNSTDYVSIFKRFGFFIPSSITGPHPLKPDAFKELPLGLTKKDAKIAGSLLKVEGMNITCAACHAGRLYDSKGAPTDVTVLGIPNTSVNFNLYLSSVYKGLDLYVSDRKSSYKLLKEIFPNLKKSEVTAIKLFITRIVEKRMKGLRSTIDAPLPFSSGSPGVTNGVASLKFVLGIMDMTKPQPEFGFTSIPGLGDRFLRTSLLYDGVYHQPGKNPFERRDSWTPEEAEALGSIAASFTMPTMGQTDKGVVRERKNLATVTKHIVEGFISPAFPGKINKDRLPGGFSIYQKNCSSCHGDYELKQSKAVLKSYPNKLVLQNEMGTDPGRWKAMDPILVKKVNSLATKDFLAATASGGYVAPLLTSLWITAPYLHNGSVPTLWALMNPNERPTMFLVGGHHLDYEKVGVLLEKNKYPSHVIPFSSPEVYDTTLSGRNNKGHEAPFLDLSYEDKKDLLEFLKLL